MSSWARIKTGSYKTHVLLTRIHWLSHLTLLGLCQLGRRLDPASRNAGDEERGVPQIVMEQSVEQVPRLPSPLWRSILAQKPSASLSAGFNVKWQMSGFAESQTCSDVLDLNLGTSTWTLPYTPPPHPTIVITAATVYFPNIWPAHV